jgi:hypothetical protein
MLSYAVSSGQLITGEVVDRLIANPWAVTYCVFLLIPGHCMHEWQLTVLVNSPKPIQYNERMRPGQAQMICASFSPGGMFLAAGSADHHVR